MLGCIAQSAVHLTEKPEVACSIPVPAIYFHEIFSMIILPLPLIQEGQLSVTGESMCT